MKKIFLLLLISATAKAEISQTSTAKANSHRQGNKVGFTTGFGNPFPSILGVNGHYNLTDYLRASAGYGEISMSSGDSTASIKTLGLGADAMVPGWSLTPLAGLHISNVDVANSGSSSLSIQGVEESTTLLYAKAGVDWQAQGGFNFGLGQVLGLSGGKASGSYMNLGWFF